MPTQTSLQRIKVAISSHHAGCPFYSWPDVLFVISEHRLEHAPVIMQNISVFPQTSCLDNGHLEYQFHYTPTQWSVVVHSPIGHAQIELGNCALNFPLSF